MEGGEQATPTGCSSDSDWSDINTDEEDKQELRIDLGDVCGASPTTVETPPAKNVERKGYRTPTRSVRRSRSSGGKRRCSVEVPADILDAIAGTKGANFDIRLDKVAKKLRLNRTQVKSVLRRLVEAPELLEIILEKSGDRPASSSVMEPRITRTLAKTVVSCGGKLNWFLETVAKTPKKTLSSSVCTALMQEEFPEDEDDQEYDPTQDPDAIQVLSDDDGDGDGVAIPSLCSVKDEDKGQPSCCTRSKSSLKMVTIEELETQFAPPDITPDMYDVCEEMDDYTQFLADTFSQPVPNIIQCGGDQEEVTDPDFVYQDDIFDKNPDEFRNNRSTKIPQKEVDSLMEELFEAYELDMEQSTKVMVLQTNDEQLATVDEKLTEDQRLLLAQQMRQHIQLLTQMTLLTCRDPTLKDLNSECKEMTSQLVGSSFNCSFSMFAQDNLFPSLAFIQEWERCDYPEICHKLHVGGNKPDKIQLTEAFMKAVADSPVFLYPHLLPLSGINQCNRKLLWSDGEDELIALSLDNFRKKKMISIFKDLSKRVMKCKTYKQIRARWKNKSDCGSPTNNPIVYFKKYNMALRSIEPKGYRNFTSQNILPPKWAPVDSLPTLWRPYAQKNPMTFLISTPSGVVVEFVKGSKDFVPILPRPTESSSSRTQSDSLISLDDALKECGIVKDDDDPLINDILEDDSVKKKEIFESKCLKNETPDEVSKRKEQEAMEIVMTAKERLPREMFGSFYEVLLDNIMDPVKAFKELHTLCTGVVDLQEMLLDLLSPEEAMEVGHLIYVQYCRRIDAKEFFRKLKILMQPTYTRVCKDIIQFLSQPDLSPNDYKNFASKLFKNNQRMHDEFIGLLPKLPYPESLMGEAEIIHLSDEESGETTSNENEMATTKGLYEDCERISEADLPVTEEEKKYGLDECPCQCHPKPATPHCIHCSIKFIDGKIYATGGGKSLRPVVVEYPQGQSPSLGKYVKRGKKRRRGDTTTTTIHEKDPIS